MSAEVERRLSLHLRGVAMKVEKLLRQVAGERVLFSLIVWGTASTAADKAAMLSYVANADRADCRKALRELLDRWDRNEPGPPVHLQ